MVAETGETRRWSMLWTNYYTRPEPTLKRKREHKYKYD
jgi:hypothetical protein